MTDRMTMNERSDALMNPAPRALSDDQRNQLAELQHEACEHHCADCGRCDWESCNPPGATRDVPMIEVGPDVWLCPDCTP